MSDAAPSPSRSSDDDLALEQAQAIDRVCNRFEQAWKDGAAPRIEDYLGSATGPERRVLLRELVAVDEYHRQARGLGVRAADYGGRFPEFDPR